MSRRPERIVHLGVGAFFRAHQAWYTQHADPAGQWGIVGFTGRSATVADELQPQDCKYNLVTRGADGDSIELMESLVRIEDGANVRNLVATISNPDIALVTLTITEAGYRVGADLECDLTDARVIFDLGIFAGKTDAEPVTTLGRLALALEARRVAEAGPIAIVPCDNMPSNGLVVRNVLSRFAAEMGVASLGYFENQVSYVTTSIDRITPKTTQRDIDDVARITGEKDASPVVTEPFSDWVLSGNFPAGRPEWQAAGARFVEDIHPFENRKLWLLNGSHSLLAYAGQLLGYQTVAEAIADEQLLSSVRAFWAEACRHLPQEGLDLVAYQTALLERFRNARIAHSLKQISNDGATKLRVRVVPTALAELEAGRTAQACAVAIASWVAWVIDTEDFVDSQKQQIVNAKSSKDPVLELVSLVGPDLLTHSDFIALVRNISKK